MHYWHGFAFFLQKKLKTVNQFGRYGLFWPADTTNVISEIAMVNCSNSSAVKTKLNVSMQSEGWELEQGLDGELLGEAGESGHSQDKDGACCGGSLGSLL